MYLLQYADSWSRNWLYIFQIINRNLSNFFFTSFQIVFYNKFLSVRSRAAGRENKAVGAATGRPAGYQQAAQAGPRGGEEQSGRQQGGRLPGRDREVSCCTCGSTVTIILRAKYLLMILVCWQCCCALQGYESGSASISHLDPDPGGKNLKNNNMKNAKKLVTIVFVLKFVK